jgi:hypothetical protein
MSQAKRMTMTERESALGDDRFFIMASAGIYGLLLLLPRPDR